MARRAWREDPPDPKTRGRHDWTKIAADLQRNEGQWKLIEEGGPISLGSAVKRRRMVAFRDEAWDYEVTRRNTNKETRTADLWLRAVRREVQQ